MATAGIYSRSAEYAIRAMAYLAMTGTGHTTTVAEISAHEQLPRQFLAHLLQTAAHAGLLVSRKGKSGGFSLARDPGEISLFDIVTAIGGPIDLDRCAVGLAQCNPAAPCALHPEWRTLRESIYVYLTRNTLATMRDAYQLKRRFWLEPQLIQITENPTRTPAPRFPV